MPNTTEGPGELKVKKYEVCIKECLGATNVRPLNHYHTIKKRDRTLSIYWAVRAKLAALFREFDYANSRVNVNMWPCVLQ